MPILPSLVPPSPALFAGVRLLDLTAAEIDGLPVGTRAGCRQGTNEFHSAIRTSDGSWTTTQGGVYADGVAFLSAEQRHARENLPADDDPAFWRLLGPDGSVLAHRPRVKPSPSPAPQKSPAQTRWQGVIFSEAPTGVLLGWSPVTPKCPPPLTLVLVVGRTKDGKTVVVETAYREALGGTWLVADGSSFTGLFDAPTHYCLLPALPRVLNPRPLSVLLRDLHSVLERECETVLADELAPWLDLGPP